MSVLGSTDVTTHVNLMVKAGSHANVMQALNFRLTATHVEVSKHVDYTLDIGYMELSEYEYNKSL